MKLTLVSLFWMACRSTRLAAPIFESGWSPPIVLLPGVSFIDPELSRMMMTLGLISKSSVSRGSIPGVALTDARPRSPARKRTSPPTRTMLAARRQDNRRFMASLPSPGLQIRAESTAVSMTLTPSLGPGAGEIAHAPDATGPAPEGAGQASGGARGPRAGGGGLFARRGPPLLRAAPP